MAVELKVGIGADISELKTGLTDAEKQIKKFLDNVVEIGKVGEKLASIGKSLSIGLTLPIVGFGAAAIKAYGDIEALKKGLEAVTGSADAANKEFTKLQVVSKLPGLGMEEAVKGSINLQAIGLSADKSRDILSQFGNAVATVGKGRAEFERAIYGVQQLANTDFPLGEDLNIIKDALPQVSNLLKEAFGTSRSDELAKMGKSSQEVLDVILVGLGKLPRVTGGIKGAFENMGDGIKTAMARIGDVINKNFDISGIIDKLVGYIDSAVEAFENLSPTVQKSILVVVGLVAAAGPLLVVIGSIMAILPSVIAGFGAFSVALTALTGPIGLVVLGIGAIIAAVVGNWDKIKPYILNTINYFRELYNESIVVRIAVAGIAVMFKNAFSAIINILKTAYEIFKSFAKNTATLFSGVGSIIEGGLTFDAGKIKEGVNKIGIAYVGTLADVGKDIKNGVNNLLTDVGTNLMGGLSSVLNDGKLKPITDLNIFDEKAIVKKEETKIDSIADKLKKKVKDKKIEIPELEFGLIGTNKSAGFMNFLGETYLSMLDFENRTREFSQNIGESLNVVPIAFSNVQLSVKESIVGLMDSIGPLADFGNLLANSLDIAFDSVVNTITDSFSAIGEALTSGGSVLSAVGNVVLSGIGSFLGELGKQMVQYGVAALAMSVLSKLLLNPITAAPAAIAMIAAGAALSLASGAIKGTLKGGASSSGTAPTSGGTGSQSYSSSFSGGGNGGGEFVFRISGNDLVAVTDRARDKNLRIGG